MANAKQLRLLKKDVLAWNNWRAINPHVDIDLTEADLRGANLSQANLSNSNLMRAQLLGADLGGSNLTKAIFRGGNLGGANLDEADLTVAHLYGCNLVGAYLIRSIFGYARIGDTIFGNSDLSKVLGLDDVVHSGPSRISTDTFVLSNGKISEVFLKGCGLPDWEIEGVKLHNPELNNDAINRILYRIYDLRATQALQVSPLFISYSHLDHAFIDKIEYHLNNKGIRFWRDIHNMRSGRMERQIDQAIHQNPNVLLVLSENSIKSDWVEHEVRTARDLEKELGRDTLCPVALDDSWKSSRWPKRIMEQVMEYNILDFSEWNDDIKFEKQFRKLIEGLDLFYKG